MAVMAETNKKMAETVDKMAGIVDKMAGTVDKMAKTVKDLIDIYKQCRKGKNLDQERSFRY